MSVPDSYFNRAAPSPQETADYEEYLASLPKHGVGPRYDNDMPDDRSDELLDGFHVDPRRDIAPFDLEGPVEGCFPVDHRSEWTREDFIRHSAEDDS